MDKKIKQFISVTNYLRHRENLTLLELSAKTGIATSTLSRIERCNLAVDISHVLKLADYYGVAVDAILRNSFQDIFAQLGELTAPMHTLYEKFAMVNLIRQRNGMTGEEWVYLQECQRLAGTVMKYAVNPRYADDDEAHFDIMTFTKDGAPVLVEVKSTGKGPDAPFYLTAAELQTAKDCVEAGILYEIHRVYYVNDLRRIGRNIITGESLLQDYDISAKKYMVRKKVMT